MKKIEVPSLVLKLLHIAPNNRRYRVDDKRRCLKLRANPRRAVQHPSVQALYLCGAQLAHFVRYITVLICGKTVCRGISPGTVPKLSRNSERTAWRPDAPTLKTRRMLIQSEPSAYS